MDIIAAQAARMSPEERAKLEAAANEQQMRDSLRMYNGLVERCFDGCVNTFRSKDVDGTESKCISACTSKFLRHSQRIGQRFAEINFAEEQRAAQGRK